MVFFGKTFQFFSLCALFMSFEPVLQDRPPSGGFASVRYACQISSNGPSPMAIFLVAVGAWSWGMYQLGKGNKIRRGTTNGNEFMRKQELIDAAEASGLSRVPIGSILSN